MLFTVLEFEDHSSITSFQSLKFFLIIYLFILKTDNVLNHNLIRIHKLKFQKSNVLEIGSCLSPAFVINTHIIPLKYNLCEINKNEVSYMNLMKKQNLTDLIDIS